MPARTARPERFLTTVLMTDIVGSTQHAAEMGDSAWRELVRVHHSRVRAALRRNGGREVDTAGDGFFAIFDAPAAAVNSALEIAREVTSLGIDIRAGVHVGEVEQTGRKVAGITVPIASRIMSLAGPGEVLVSATVRDLAAGASLRVEDRGTHELKGVPGAWQVFSVRRAGDDAAAELVTSDAAKQRAAAVRSARSRPLWRRYPRATALAVIGLAVVVVGAGLLIWKPWQPPALAAISEDSLGIIDGGRSEIVASIAMTTPPGAMAAADGAVWVANTSANTVSRVDTATRAVTREIDVGRAPAGIAIGGGSVWVANSGDRTVSRINIETARVVDTITVGNGPSAIAAGDGAIWVANTADSTVVRLDASSGAAGKPIPVAAGPIALAVDDSGVWVASSDGAAVTRLDPSTGGTLAAPIPLGTRPTAIAVGQGAVWVANSDGTVTKIDPTAVRMTATIDVGGTPSALSTTTSAVWVADRNGFVDRLDPANPATPAVRIATGSAPETLVAVGTDVWVATRPGLASHRGGTLHIVSGDLPHPVDPLGIGLGNPSVLEGDGLVGYRRVGGISGTELLPDLAVAIPRPTNGGLSYTFQLRPNLVYSTGAPVAPADFRRAIERTFQVGAPPFGPPGPGFFSSIVGADKCSPETCDLSAAIVVDDANRTVTFNLSSRDPDFLYKLAMSMSYPVPEGVPMNAPVDGAFPGTGPYTIASASATEVRLTRNPHFAVWDAEVRPDGYPDEIIWSYGISADDRIAMVEKGDADFLTSRGPDRLTAEQLSELGVQYPAQLHFGSVITNGLILNTAAPPFDRLEARQALSLAIDRGHVADLYGGSPGVAITCQFLPAGTPGYVPYCPYTAAPDAGGQWHAPDLEAAKQLVEKSGTKGAAVVVGPVKGPDLVPARDHYADLIGQLGYNVTVDEGVGQDAVDSAISDGRMQVWLSGWVPDYFAPANFFGWLTCTGAQAGPPVSYCDPEFDALYQQALDLQTIDAAAATAKWSEVDHAAVDRAIWIPIDLQGSDFLSARAGNYQFNPAYIFLFDQVWVK